MFSFLIRLDELDIVHSCQVLSLLTHCPLKESRKQGCACFPEFLQNFSERQILWSLYLVVFHALTLKLPIQSSLSVEPKLQVCVRSGENVKYSGKQAYYWIF